MTQCLPRRETGPKPKPYLLRQSGINIWLLFVFAYWAAVCSTLNSQG
jgi:hypothetical protein